MTAITRVLLDEVKRHHGVEFDPLCSLCVMEAALRRVLDLRDRWAGSWWITDGIDAALAGTQTDDGAGGVAVITGGEPAPSSPDRIRAVERALREAAGPEYGTYPAAAEHAVAALDAYDREHVASLDPADYVEVIWRDDEDRRCHTFVSRFVKAQIEADLRERIAAEQEAWCLSQQHGWNNEDRARDEVCSICAGVARIARGGQS